MFAFFKTTIALLLICFLLSINGLTLNMKKKNQISVTQALQNILAALTSKSINSSSPNPRALHHEDIDSLNNIQRPRRDINSSGEYFTNNKTSDLITQLSKIANVRMENKTITEKAILHNSTVKEINYSESGHQKIHCDVIQEVYVPPFKMKLPAYSCNFGKKKFVLTSILFLKDKQPQFDAIIDDNTYQTLNAAFHTPVQHNVNQNSNIFAAMLIQKVNETNYEIRIS